MGFNNCNDMQRANEIVNSFSDNVKIKRVRNDKGLIERAEDNSERIILAEDNRQVLFG